jgi:Holliday junction resolvasome RuvABC DNA-binding subunit
MKALARVISQQLNVGGLDRFNPKVINSRGYTCSQEGDSVVVFWVGDSAFKAASRILLRHGYEVEEFDDFLSVSKPVPVAEQIDLSVKHTEGNEDLIRRSLLQLGFKEDNPERGVDGFGVWWSPLLDTGWVRTRELKMANEILNALETLGYEKWDIETHDDHISLSFKIKFGGGQ